ncbi:hypothetical protein CC2G_000091 [Coprinopsis cinerea AmutBmut pab1-1]|nr:hypothetical protein CC2G_000091 [Coprinopsis cinerea AmutBmut pab1-1]
MTVAAPRRQPKCSKLFLPASSFTADTAYRLQPTDSGPSSDWDTQELGTGLIHKIDHTIDNAPTRSPTRDCACT